MKSLCNRRVSGWNPDTLKEIVRFVHEVHPVFAVTLSTFLHRLCGSNDDTMPTVNLFRVHFKLTLKRLKVGMVSSFRPHSMCKRVERVTAKTGRTSCANWTISFGVSGFRRRTHLLHGRFNVFKTYLSSGLFLCSVCSIQSDFINFQHVLTSFVFFGHLPNCLES